MDEAAPLWVVLFVGLGSGLIGTVLATLLRVSHERTADLRSRMLETADSFAVAADAAVTAFSAWQAQGLMDAAFKPLPSEDDSDDIELGSEGQLHATEDDCRRLDVRLRLLFGPRSATAAAARAIFELLGDGYAAAQEQARTIRALRRSGTPKDSLELEAQHALRKALDVFSDAARRDLYGLRLWRFPRRRG